MYFHLFISSKIIPEHIPLELNSFHKINKTNILMVKTMCKISNNSCSVFIYCYLTKKSKTEKLPL